MAKQPSSDRQLIKRFQRGELAAFENFIIRYQDRLTRLAATQLYDFENVEDAVQEVFLRSFKGLSRFHFSAEPFTWLYRCLSNVCKEMNRNSEQRKNKENPIMEEPIDVQQDIETQLDDRHTVRRISLLINELPKQQREVVVLRIFEELSVNQTANILGCRPGTVKAHLHKAIANLRHSPNLKTLQKEYYDGR